MLSVDIVVRHATERMRVEAAECLEAILGREVLRQLLDIAQALHVL